MDIYRIHPFGVPGAAPAPTVETEDQGFSEILQRRTSEAAAAGPGAGPADSRSALLDRGDRILDSLATFAADLGNPGKTLKEMAPLVAEIDRQVQQLEAETGADVRRDDGLHDLLRDLQVTARVAVFKYQRGDFIG